MTMIEDVLDEAIHPGQAGSVDHDWASVVADGQKKRQRQATASSVGLLVVAAIGLFILLPSILGSGAGERLDVWVVPPAGEAQVEQPLEIWPSSAEVFAAAGPRAGGEIVLAWLVALGLPLLAAGATWLQSSRPARNGLGYNTRQRAARSVGAALGTVVGLTALVGVALSLFYFPLAAQTGRSTLVFTMSALSVSLRHIAIAATVAGFALRGEFGWVLRGYVFLGTALVAPLWIEPRLSWTHTAATEMPGVGLWRLVVPGDATHFGPSGVLSAGGAALGFAMASAGCMAALWWAMALRKVEANERIAETLADRRPSMQDFCGGLFFVSAVALMLWAAVVGQDARARETLYMVELPAELTVQTDVVINRYVDSDMFDENKLSQIVIRGGDIPITDVTNEELFGQPAPSGLFQPGLQFNADGAALTSYPGPAEVWDIERDVAANTITVRAWRSSYFGPLFGLNTAIFMSAMLFLAATSRRLLGRSADTIVGRKAASWYAIIGAAVIATRLVQSVVQLKSDIGWGVNEFGPFFSQVGNSSLGNPPISALSMSGWWFFNGLVLLPVFGLALIGLRRRGLSTLFQLGFVVLALLASVAVIAQFGDLISAWTSFAIDT